LRIEDGDWGTAGLVARQDGQVARATHSGGQKSGNVAIKLLMDNDVTV